MGGTSRTPSSPRHRMSGLSISRRVRPCPFRRPSLSRSETRPSRASGSRPPGGDPQQLTNDSGSVFFPQWSPDGGEIIMHGFRGDRRQLFVVAAEGGPLRQITRGADHRLAVWRPDGQSVGMVTEFGTGTGHVEVTSRSSDGPWSAPQAVPLVLGRDTLQGRDIGGAAWSPDGRFLACANRSGLLIAPAVGGQVRMLALPAPPILVARPQWSADSRWVYYLALDSSGVVGSVNGVSVAGGPPHVFVRFDDPTRPWHRYGVGVHGQTVYVTLGDLESDIWVADITSRR